MSAPDISVNPKLGRLMRNEARPLMPATESASSLQLSPNRSRQTRIAVIGNHLPRQCGIATFTTDLCDALAAEYGAAELSVVAINDQQSNHHYPDRVRFQITEGEISSYQEAADFLNSSNVDLVCLQHEYGIFGGKSGSHILRLLQKLKMPVVTTLHTVLREPNPDQRIIMEEVAMRSDRLIVMSEHSSRFLQDVFKIPCKKIELIPHGIPDLPFVEPEIYKNRSSAEGKTVLLTFGLLSSNKGFESVIRALPRILSRHSNVIYIIAGATHPHVRLREGDQYRFQLQALAKEMGVEENVIFYNRFVSPQEMASLVGSADIYITPYRYEAQAVSGTLAYALGSGKAIISTPYWHASELLSNGRGALVPFEDPGAIAATTIELLDNDAARQAMRNRAYLYGRRMVWNRIAQLYMHTFVQVCMNRMRLAHTRFSAQAIEPDIMSRSANG